MAFKKVIPVEDAVALIRDGDVLATSGYGGHGVPEQLLIGLETRFLETAAPRALTLGFRRLRRSRDVLKHHHAVAARTNTGRNLSGGRSLCARG